MNHFIRLVVLCTLGIVGAGCVTHPAADDPRAAEVDALLHDVMQRDALPSISVAVAQDGQLVYQRTHGLADVASGMRATADTVYAQGSVSKILTATAALMLAKQGKLDLDAPVQEYCTAFPEKSATLTTRQLLAHTAGVRHYDYRRFAEDFLNDKAFNSIPDAMQKFAADPLIATPGEKYHYSSWGYVVAACAIEGASGSRFEDVMQQRIFSVAGMKHSLLDHSGLQLAARATGYSLQDDGSLKAGGVQDPSDRYGASGWLATPGDVARFASALLDGKFLDADARRMMWRAQILSNGESTDHGLGWDLDATSGAVMKGGTAFDASSFLYVLPDEKLVVVINTNRVLWNKGREALAAELAALYRQQTGSK